MSGWGGVGSRGWPTLKTKVSTADTTPDFLFNEIVGGAGIGLAILNPGANEQLQISYAGIGGDLVSVSAADTTPGYLNTKVAAGSNIVLTILNPGGNEQQEVAVTTTPTFNTLNVETSTLLNTNKLNSFTPLQLLGSVIDLSMSVDVTGSFWTINASAAAGKLILDGNGELILKASLGEVLMQNSATAAMSDISMFPNVLAMGIPAGLKLSGRNLTDSARRTLRMAMHPSIDNCVLFSGVGKYCFDDNIDIIRASAGLITFSSAVTADSDFRFRLNADGKIQWGSGAAAPDISLERSAANTLKYSGNTFHIQKGSSGASSAGTFIIEAAGAATMSVLSGSGSVGAIYFGDSGDNDIAQIEYSHATNVMRIRSNGTYILTMSNVGLGINVAVPVSAIDIAASAGKGYITMEELSADGAVPAANHGILYLKDVGGKTALFARFNTGAVQQIAIEP